MDPQQKTPTGNSTNNPPVEPLQPARQPMERLNVPERNGAVNPPLSRPIPPAPVTPVNPQPLPQSVQNVSVPAQPTNPTPAAPPIPQQPVETDIPPVPANVLPPTSPPAVPTLQPEPKPEPTPPVTPIVSPEPKPAAPTTPAAPSTPVKPTILPKSPEPTPPPQRTAPTIPTPVAAQPEPLKPQAGNLVDRISEVPMQNSADITKLANKKRGIQRLRGFLSFLVFIAGIFLAAFLINQFIFQSYYVEGTSMTPTLQNDDRLIIDKVGRTAAMVQGKPYLPARGEVVVLDSSIVTRGGQHEQLIKRVIGLPGDTVIVDDGKVTIKNAQSPDGFNVDAQLGLNLKPTYSSEKLEVKVQANQLFVMGDNRVENGSYDSRAFGVIQADDIEGRLWARILPLDKAKVF